MNVLKYLKSRRVAVLKGGWSSERAISLKTGSAMEASLRKMGIKPVSVDAGRDLAQVLARKKIGFAFLALHGPGGEDGSVQGLLEVLRIPYAGSGVLASAAAMDKVFAKKIFIQVGLPTPAWRVVKSPTESLKGLKWPLVVKPVAQGSALGTNIVRSRGQWSRACRAALRYGGQALVEECVQGREFTVGVLGDEALPVIEIIPNASRPFYDFQAKYAPGGSRHLCPAPISGSLARKLKEIGLSAYRALGCRGMGRADVMVNKKGKPYLLEVNTLPGMTSTSLLPEAAQAAGYSFEEMLLKITEHSLT